MSVKLYETVDQFRKKAFLKCFENEISWLEKKGTLINEDTERLGLLKKIYSKLTEVPHEKTSTFQNNFKKMESQIYMQEWRRLPEFHKLIKIREYIKDMKSDKQDDVKKRIEEMLIDAVTSKKLNSNKSVNYDIKQCKILDIPVLKWDDDTPRLKLKP